MAKESISTKLHQKHRNLKDEVIEELRKMIGDKTIDLEEMEQEFNDMLNNPIKKVDKDNVYFDGTMESYPLGELEIEDALYIMGVIEG